MRIGIATSVATAIAIGVLAASQGGGVTFELFVATTGNDATCARLDQAHPCLTLDKARDLAQCGDDVSIAAGTYDNQQTIASAPNSCGNGNQVNFRVPSGTASFTTNAAAELTCAETGSSCGISIASPGTNIRGITFGYVVFGPNCDYCGLYSSTGQKFDINSADHTTIDGNTLDGDSITGQSCQNFMWPITGQPSTNPQDGITITNNTIRDFKNCGGDHSEGLYVGGYSQNVLISGNTFYNNGNTAHIFVTWCAPSNCSNTGNDPDARDPKNVCIKGNTFQETWEAFYDITIRQEDDPVFPPVAPNGHGIYTDDNDIFSGSQSFVNGTTNVPGRTVQLYDSAHNTWAVGSC